MAIKLPPPKTLDELKKESEEPAADYSEKFVKISGDKSGDSLTIRIPRDISRMFGIKKGQWMRFLGTFKEDGTKQLQIEVTKNGPK